MEKIESTLDSREVAEMVGKNHKNLLRDITRYTEQINESNLALVAELKIEPSDFFRKSTYRDINNKNQPCYQITKKGCEFIAHKLTGRKGTEFTARYINRFHEMEDIIKGQQSQNRQEQIEQALLEVKNLLEKKDRKIKELELKTKTRYDDTFFRQEIQRYAGMITDTRRLRQIYTITHKLYEYEIAKA